MKILCFGASNTYGYDPRSYFGSQYPAQYRWVDLLAEKLNCTAITEMAVIRDIIFFFIPHLILIHISKNFQ